MSVAFDNSRFTMNIDGRILAGHGPVTDAVRGIACRHDWPETWLNEEAVSAIPRARDFKARTVYGGANLMVTAASAEHLLAMKVRAARGKDLDDIRRLVRHLDLGSVKDVFDIHDQVFPDQPLSEESLQVVQEFFADLWSEDQSTGNPDQGHGKGETGSGR